MTTAWLFPGQGLIAPAMGLAQAEVEPAARELLDLAGELVKLDVRKLLQRGDPALEQSEVIQPLLTAVTLGSWESLRQRAPPPAFVAGHSLGEIAAWAASGAISAADAVRLAARRGKIMGQAARERPGGMICLMAEADTVEVALAHGAEHGTVVLAGENTPREWVLSGEQTALDAIVARFTTRRLAVPGAWHSTAMASAVAPFRLEVEALRLAPPRTPMISNRNGRPADPASVPRLLAEQLIHPVRFIRVLETLEAAGVRRLVTLGPGRVLRGMIRANLWTRVEVLTTENPADLERSAAALAGDA